MGEGVVAGRARRADQGLHRQARGALTPMATIAMREVRDGRGAAATAAPRSRRTPTGPCSAATAPTTTSACSAATCSPTAMDAAYMTKKVRVRCGRCRTVNVAVTDESIDPRRQAPLSASSAGAVARVGGRAVAVDGRDPDRPADGPSPASRGRAARRGRRARAGTPPKPKPLAGMPRESVSVVARQLAAELPVLRDVEADARAGGVELERGEPGRGEVRGAVDLDHASRSARARGRRAAAGSRARRAAPRRRP